MWEQWAESSDRVATWANDNVVGDVLGSGQPTDSHSAAAAAAAVALVGWGWGRVVADDDTTGSSSAWHTHTHTISYIFNIVSHSETICLPVNGCLMEGISMVQPPRRCFWSSTSGGFAAVSSTSGENMMSSTKWQYTTLQSSQRRTVRMQNINTPWYTCPHALQNNTYQPANEVEAIVRYPQQTWPTLILRLLTSTKWRHSTGLLLAAMFTGEDLLDNRRVNASAVVIGCKKSRKYLI